jgi:hypothetical protein
VVLRKDDPGLGTLLAGYLVPPALVLAELLLAADETVPPGLRFETFVYADRVLGLDLPRDIGR